MVKHESTDNILPPAGLDASVIELNDSALSISENQGEEIFKISIQLLLICVPYLELNQHVESEDSILPVSEGDSSVEVLMNTSIALQLNQGAISQNVKYKPIINFDVIFRTY